MAACILAASVRVVDKVYIRLPFNAFQCHPEGFERVGRLQCGSHAPPDYLFCVCIHYQRQITETIGVIPVLYENIGYVTYPQLVRESRYKLPYQIGICRETMGGVRCLGLLSRLLTYLHAVVIEHGQECISAYRFPLYELLLVQLKYLLPSDTRVFLADQDCKLQGKCPACSSCQGKVLIVLVIGLLCKAKQFAECSNWIFVWTLRVQVINDLAPYFFLIGMLNFFSARSMIFAFTSARIVSRASCFSNSAILFRRSSLL